MKLSVLLFCLWPFLNLWAFWQKEYSDIGGSQLIVVWMTAALSVSVLLYTVLKRFAWAKEQAAELAALAVTLFFLKRFVSDVIWPGGSIFLILYLAVLFAAFLIFKNLKISLQIFRIMAVTLVIVAAAQLIYFLNKNRSLQPTPPAPLPSITPKRNNNVYYFILDGYTRNDFLEKYFHFDNRPFSQFLIDHGFYHFSKARSNYHQTLFSVPSLFKMDYPVQKEGKIEAWEELRDDLKRTFWLREINDAPIFSEFQRRGYDLIYANAYGIPIRSVNLTVEGPQEGFSSPAMELVNSTPLPYLLKFANGKLGTMKHRFPQNPLAVIEQVQSPRSPFFFFIHVFSPHPPYVYRADCSPRDGYSFILNPDDLDYIAEGTVDVYLEQLRCLNKQMSSAIEKILEKDPDAIIGIQADHGFPSPLPKAMRLNNEGLEANILFGIQNWIRIPGVKKDWLYPSLSPVNMFRLIFASLDDKIPAYLPDESYYISTSGPNEGKVIRQSDK